MQSELKAYRCLVPDWSKTSGGSSPALSPDGKTLVYLVHYPGDTANDKIWVIFDVDSYQPGEKYAVTPTKIPEPWQLQIDLPHINFSREGKPSLHVQRTSYTPEFRNVDWSPNGEHVAFIFNGRLFVAEYSDLKARSSRARMLADVAIVPPENAPTTVDPAKDMFAEPVLAPRWSPDGTRIAFLRPGAPGQANRVCVVDLRTDKESEIANDSSNGTETWEQPWSPDGKYLAYTSSRPAMGGGTVEMGGISIVPVAGGAARKLVDQANVFCPSWSPDSKRLAYLGPSKDRGIGSMVPVVYIINIDGTGSKPITQNWLPDSQLSAVQMQMNERLRKVLSENYSGLFTAAQIKVIAPGRISDSDAMAALIISEGMRQSKAIGGEFKRVVEAAIKHYPIKGNNRLRACVDISHAANKLPKDAQDKFQQRLMQTLSDVTRPLTSLVAAFEMAPVWSPDGKSVAFTRWNIPAATMQLITVDLATSKIRILFESSVLESVSWAVGGRSLILDAKRNLAYSGKTEDPNNLWPDSITMPSYPEVWILDLK
ncbi:MAG: hypothetical protein ABFD54_12585 [Armatimonadota bacterium]